MRQALEETIILGPITNVDFLHRVIGHAAFLEGRLHTGFLEQYKAELVVKPPTQEQEMLLLAVAALAHPDFDARYDTPAPLANMGAWRN